MKGGIQLKKVISLLLVLVIAVSAVSVCYADNADADNVEKLTKTGGKTIDIKDPNLPASPSVVDVMYNEDTVLINDGSIPASGTESSVDTVNIGDQSIPQASSLPKTGGIPAELFYAAGGIFVAAALVLTLVRKKAA